MAFNIFVSAKKKHFLKCLETTQKQIWDNEFKKFQGQQIRESVRLERDKGSEAADALRAEIKREHKPETQTVLEKELTIAEGKIKNLEEQLKMIDLQIEGAPYVSPEEPGMHGLNDTIASLSEVRKMFISYIDAL